MAPRDWNDDGAGRNIDPFMFTFTSLWKVDSSFERVRDGRDFGLNPNIVMMRLTE